MQSRQKMQFFLINFHFFVAVRINSKKKYDKFDIRYTTHIHTRQKTGQGFVYIQMIFWEVGGEHFFAFLVSFADLCFFVCVSCCKSLFRTNNWRKLRAADRAREYRAQEYRARKDRAQEYQATGNQVQEGQVWKDQAREDWAQEDRARDDKVQEDQAHKRPTPRKQTLIRTSPRRSSPRWSYQGRLGDNTLKDF